jgi:SpoVK/Ycf46/Vps4 family AAA+-type ATPase
LNTNGRHRPKELTAHPLRAPLQRLELMLRRQVLRLRARHQLVEHDFRGAFISDEQVDALFENAGPAGQPEAPSAQALTEQITLLTTAEQFDSAGGLNRLAALFGLNPVERDILLIALAAALDARFEIFFAYVQNDVVRKAPTVDLALKLLFDDFDERLAAQQHFHQDQPLRRQQMIELIPAASSPAGSLLSHFIKIDPRVVAFALEQDVLDEQILQFCNVVELDESPALPFPADLLDRLDLAAASLAERAGVIFLHGPAGVGKRRVAATLSARHGWKLLTIDWDALRKSGQPEATALARIRREAVMRNAAIYFFAETEPIPDLSQLDRPVFWGQTQAIFQINLQLPHVVFALPRPDFRQRLALWQQLTADLRTHPDLSLAAVAGKFVLTAGQIKNAVQRAVADLQTRPGSHQLLTEQVVHRAARWCSNQALRELAQPVDPKYTWADITLPPLCRQQLHEVYLSVKHRHTVYAEWGFDAKLAAGKGVTALFFGPSGTGKTMSAQILANELKLDLYKIDLSTVVSKYIGETEQNLSRIFDAAEASNAILFFDEADALFGKRSEVKDARDRYANIEVAYLLQKMEEYDGIAILATNLHGNMDEAFARRLHHAVEFKLPDVKLRERIWHNVFPQQTPLADTLDYAFLAAEDGQPVSMEMIVTAVSRELQKMGKLPTKDAFQHYYAQL